MKLKQFNVFILSLIVGGAIALIGYQQYQSQKKQIEFPQLAERIKKEHNTPIAQLVFALHGSYNIENIAKNPQKVKDLLKTKEELSISDKSALNQLIEKVTTK